MAGEATTRFKRLWSFAVLALLIAALLIQPFQVGAASLPPTDTRLSPATAASTTATANAAPTTTTPTPNVRTEARAGRPGPRTAAGSSTTGIGRFLAAKGASSGWRVGDDIWSATRAGNHPAWSTVRGRYWKNVANDPARAAQWDEANLARMRSGRAPQRFNPDKGGMESMELSHEPIPAREGGCGLVPRWPQDHAAVDPYRHPGY